MSNRTRKNLIEKSQYLTKDRKWYDSSPSVIDNSDKPTQIININRLDDSHIYYDMSIFPNNGFSQPPLPTIFPDAVGCIKIDTRSDAIIDKPEDYHLSIIRFSVNGTGIPIFIYPTLGESPNITGANNTLISITLNQGGNDYQGFTIWATQDTVAAPNMEGYYYCFSYQHFINLINAALAAQHALLFIAVPAVGAAPPYMILDAANEMISILAPITYVANNVKLYFSTGLYSFFENYNAVYGSYSAINGKNVEIVIADTKNNTAIAGYYEMRQEYANLQKWNYMKSIVMKSILIPAKEEYLSNKSSFTSDNFDRILTDFEPSIGGGADNRSLFQYLPTAEYRRLDLKGLLPLTKIDISMYWKDLNDKLHLIQLIPYSGPATIKFLFEKKKFKDIQN